MSNILDKTKDYFGSKDGNFVVGVIGIVGAIAGIVFGILPFFGGEVVPAEVVQTIMAKHEVQLSQKDKRLLSQEELNKQLLEVVNVLLLSQRQDDLEAGDALQQLQVGQTGKAKAYFGKWTKIADNKQKSNWARYAGTLDYLDDPDVGKLQFQEALRLDPENPQNPMFQNYIGKVENKTTGNNSPIIDKIDGDVTFGLPVDKEK